MIFVFVSCVVVLLNIVGHIKIVALHRACLVQRWVHCDQTTLAKLGPCQTHDKIAQLCGAILLRDKFA